MDHTSALKYLKQSLENEEYEQSQGYIDQALHAGAQPSDVESIIAAYLKAGSKASAQRGHLPVGS